MKDALSNFSSKKFGLAGAGAAYCFATGDMFFGIGCIAMGIVAHTIVDTVGKKK